MGVQRFAELIDNLVNMGAFCYKGWGKNSIIAGKFHVQAIPEHIFLHLCSTATRNPVMVQLNSCHHAKTA